MLVTEERPRQQVAARPRRWSRALRWTLAAILVVVAGGVLVVWWINRPPAPVSVSNVIDRFRDTSSAPGAQSHGGLAVGVYLYRTDGSERVSFGHVTHHYPSVTTLTVTSDPCGLKFRWDALAGRYGEWQVCRSVTGWSLVRYVDVHTFLTMTDTHAYTCSGFPAVTCKTGTGVLTSTVARIGRESVVVDGSRLAATHVHITQVATGKSVSNGSIDAWVLPSGLPARIAIVDHGSQTVLGSHVTYQEAATFVLSSITPRR